MPKKSSSLSTLNSAAMRPPRRQASLDAYRGFRDVTHGADESNVPTAYTPKGGRGQSRVPYAGSGDAKVQ